MLNRGLCYTDYRYTVFHFAQCHFSALPNVIMQNIIMLNAIILSVLDSVYCLMHPFLISTSTISITTVSIVKQ
jgi:hypothetical protein